ncbi:hypothetical protein BS78_K207800 [Paspalum vaginatum]|uniref:Uncharacterized protein n=1 Tax=Paspalum vaginatum TaxID=158149 RepID=A0A9W7X5U5_9POAL|nr:hypothetical protein BS78_K207800 [Paspalum vaginatum]
MASQSHHDALWAKLHQLELQLAAYKLLRAARGEDAGASGCADGAGTPGGGSTCRGRQYDAYMRRRDARRLAASAEQHQPLRRKAQKPRATPMSPRAARCGARDAHEAGAATPRPVGAQAKRTPSILPVPSTPRRELPRSRTASGAAAACGSPARPPSHQRRSSLGAAAELGECATPRPFLKRGTGTGGAAAPARARVHDLPAIDVAAATPRQELAQAPRHARSVSELPLETAALASPQAARPRKRWGSPERPAAMYSAANSHGRDLSKGLRKLLSFVRKGGRSGGGGDQAAVPAPSPRGGGKPVTVSKGWSGCSPVDVPLDRGASLEGHRFPMTRAVGISG